jgi:hypothetical protein
VFHKGSTCKDVYSRISNRVSRYLTAPIQDSLNACQGFVVAKRFSMDNLASDTSTTNSGGETPPAPAKAELARNDSGGSDDSFTAVLNPRPTVSAGVQRVLTEDVLAGNEIPRHGFSLRTITAHASSNNVCSRCPWLAACQGCLIPDDDTPVRMNLRFNESNVYADVCLHSDC